MSLSPIHFLKFALLLAVGLGLSLPALGFRPGQGAPPGLIEKFEERFVVDSQCERYEVLEIFADGRIERWEILMLYQYRPDKVYGLIRVLPTALRPGTVALTVQEAGKTPHIFSWRPGQAETRQLEGPPARATIGDSPWHYENMLDDDKEPWDWQRGRGRVFVEGVECNVLIGNWGDPEMRYNSAFGQRRMHLPVGDLSFARTEFFDRRGNFVKTIAARDYRVVDRGEDGQPRLRAHRIDITNAERNSQSMFLLREGRYDLPLPEGLFDPAFLPQWSTETDSKLLALVRGEEVQP
ncbi:MAG: outer membrane lipoprotein-sorting protein [Opitutales bacterium]